MAGRVSRDGQAGGITRMVSVQWEMEPCIIECAQGGGTKKGSPDTKGFPDKKIEQVMGIEPTYLAWKASVLPLNYTCIYAIHAAVNRGDRIRTCDLLVPNQAL